MDFTEKTVLISGASRGIGRATAQEFAQRGARVAVHYHQNREAAERTRDELVGDGHAIFQADIADAAAVARLADAVRDQMGPIDILVNNAGIFEDHPLAETGYEAWQQSWERVLQTNLVGAANLSYCVARQMIENGGGSIVNVSSRGAFRGEPQSPAYGASKAGLNAMSQSLAQHLAPHGIHVTVVAPGFVKTDMAADVLEGPEGDAIRNQSPLGRVARPEEVAYTVLFLASEEARFLTGAIVDVNGASYLRS